MAILTTLNGKGKYFNDDAKELVTDYILRRDKAISGYFGGLAVDPLCPAESMMLISEQFGKQDGVQLRHFVISFAPDETNDPAFVNKIAQQTAMFVGQDYQVLYAVHENEPHLHFHLIHNSVNYHTGARYYGRKKEFYAFQNALKGILRQYGINDLRYVSGKE